MKKIVLLSVFCIVLISVEKSFCAEKVTLYSLEWPPHASNKMVGNGNCAEIVRKIFNQNGIEVDIKFTPWLRAIRDSKASNETIGIFPQYYTKQRAESYYFSKAIGCSALVLVYHKKLNLKWKKVSDLFKYRIGLVAGYHNTSEIDAAAKSGLYSFDYVSTDYLNILKLIKKRIDVAVIDENVYRYMINIGQISKEDAALLQVSKKVIAVHRLYLCFVKTELAKKYLKIFDEGLLRDLKLNVDKQCKTHPNEYCASKCVCDD